MAEILTRGEWANDPERELAEVVLAIARPPDHGQKQRRCRAESARCDEMLRDVTAWARVLAFHPDLKQRRRHFASFVHPEKLDFDNLVAREFTDPELPTLFEGPPRDSIATATASASPIRA